MLTLEAGAWRMVQLHMSMPIPNEEVIGYELTTTLSDLLSSLDDDPAVTLQAKVRSDTATVMFTDIVESTAISLRLGDQAWTALIKSHFEECRNIVENEDGVVVKTLGDGGMFVFTSAGSALRAAARVQQSVSHADGDISVRIGVHTGDLVHEGGDYLGTTVNKAARVAAAAKGNQILVSSTTADMTSGSNFQYGTPTSLTLRGLEGSHQVVPLLWDEI